VLGGCTNRWDEKLREARRAYLTIAYSSATDGAICRLRRL
jgi:hypothetical protein